MPWGLKRYYGTGGRHFITSSCYQRRPLLASPERRDLLLAVLERMRERYRFAVVGYVVMPEHFHLLISEPEVGTPSTVMQAVKLGFAKRVLNRVSASRAPLLAKDARNGAPVARVVPANRGGRPHHVWQARFYDFNVWSQRKEIEKLGYMHSNPVERGLVWSLAFGRGAVFDGMPRGSWARFG